MGSLRSPPPCFKSRLTFLPPHWEKREEDGRRTRGEKKDPMTLPSVALDPCGGVVVSPPAVPHPLFLLPPAPLDGSATQGGPLSGRVVLLEVEGTRRPLRGGIPASQEEPSGPWNPPGPKSQWGPVTGSPLLSPFTCDKDSPAGRRKRPPSWGSRGTRPDPLSFLSRVGDAERRSVH